MHIHQIIFVWNVSFFLLERKQITLTVGNQLAYKKIYNVVGYLKGKHNPGLNWFRFLLPRVADKRWRSRGSKRDRKVFAVLNVSTSNLWNITMLHTFGWIWRNSPFCILLTMGQLCFDLSYPICFYPYALLVVFYYSVTQNDKTITKV